MSALLTIGEFSRATHLSVKALRHYDDVGLLQPVDVDPSSGYRRYASAQIPTAHVIRRFRALDMPLERVRAVLEAPDIEARDRAIITHLEQMEQALEQTQATVSSLKALLEGREPTLSIEYRSVAATPAMAIRGDVDWSDVEHWLTIAFDEIHQVLGATPQIRAGVDAALFSAEFFERHRGEVVAFVPISSSPAVVGRVRIIDIAASRLAIIVHEGPFSELDQAYGALGTFVAERFLAAAGPIREHYLVTATDDPERVRTEVCWPIRRDPQPAER